MKKIQEHLGLVFLIIIAIFAVAIGGYFTLRKGVFIGDDFYYKVRADKFVHNTVNYVERTKDDTFLLVADGKKQNVSCTMKGDQVTFSSLMTGFSFPAIICISSQPTGLPSAASN